MASEPAKTGAKRARRPKAGSGATKKKTAASKKVAASKKTRPAGATKAKRSPTASRKSAKASAASEPRKTAARKTGAKVVAPAARTLSAEERSRMIRDAAYFRSIRRGAAAADPVRDWLEAEAEVDARLLAESKGERD